MATPSLPVILGCGIIGDSSDPTAKINSPALAQEYVDAFRKHGGKTIDTSRRYSTNAPGTSELLLGTTNISTWAAIDTKVESNPGDHAPEKIASSISKSLDAMHIPSLHTMYLHFPDRTQPLESVCAAMARGIEEGKMQQWGISNYSINEVKQIVEICTANNYPKPRVYQGHYNAITRKMEDALLPCLRQSGIAFYAYSPAAGGAFSKTSSRLNDVGKVGDHVRANYNSSDSLKSAISLVQAEAEKHGLTGHEVALRWVRFHSALKAELGDGMVVGASSPAQLESTMKGLAMGPLPDAVVEAVNGVWASARDTAPNYSPLA